MDFTPWQHDRSGSICTFRVEHNGETLTGDLTRWNRGYFSVHVNEYPGFEASYLADTGKRPDVLAFLLRRFDEDKPGLLTVQEIADMPNMLLRG